MATTFDTTSPDALRKAIIARLGISPDKLTAFGGNPEFDAKVTGLYQDTTSRLGGLDTAQARLGSDYEQNLALQQAAQRRAAEGLDNSLADRGLLSSGIATTQKAQMNEDYANRLNQLNQARTRGLEDIGTQRNNLINSLLSGRGSYEAEYTKNLSDFLQQQATNAAQLAASKPIAAPAAPKKPTAAAVQRRVAAPVAAPKLSWGGTGTTSPSKPTTKSVLGGFKIF